MYLSEFRLDPTLYFNAVPHDVVNYTQQLWRPFSVGTRWYRTHSMPHGMQNRKHISIAVTQDNTYLFAFKDRVCIIDTELPLICVREIHAMILDHNDHIWLCVNNWYSWCVIEYTKNGTILTFVECRICPFLHNVVAYPHPVSHAVPGDCGVPCESCAVMSDRSRVAFDMQRDITMYAPSRPQILHRIGDNHSAIRAIVVDAEDNVIVLFYSNTVKMFNKTLTHQFTQTLSYKTMCIGVDKNGSILCSTKDRLIIIDTV